MKIRNGFVSNSSSSSFVIPINAVDNNQINMIVDHIKIAQKYKVKNKKSSDGYNFPLEYCDSSDSWNIEINKDCIIGETIMDNFNMSFFLRQLVKIKDKYILWDLDSNYRKQIKKMNSEIIIEQRKEKLKKINNEN